MQPPTSRCPNRPDPATAPTLETAVRVRVAIAEHAQLTQSSAVTGVVAAFRKATVAAETGGRVLARRVEPGDVVASGATLIEIDPVRARLAVDRARAQTAAQQVDVDEAERDVERSQRLHAREVISRDVLDNHLFALDRARSRLASARAAQGSAERELSDAVVTAPFAGIGRARARSCG